MVHPNSLKNLKPIKPGECLNPAGRPKGIKYISEIMREVLEEEGVQAEIKKQIKEKLMAELDVLPWAKIIEVVRDTTEGKPTLRIEAETKSDLAITLDADIPVEEISNGKREPEAGRGAGGQAADGQAGDVPQPGGEPGPQA